MDRHEAYQVLGILPPFTERKLKSVFRMKAINSHPDKGGTSDQFCAVKEAFDLLTLDASKDIEAVILETIEGRDISTLGKGLKVSATKCKDCRGHGYTTESQFIECPICSGFICRRLTLSEILFRFTNQFACRACHGTGFSEIEQVRCWVCRVCNGVGEVAIFNPVFIKGSISSKQQKQPRKQKEAPQLSIAKIRQMEQTAKRQQVWANLHDELKGR